MWETRKNTIFHVFGRPDDEKKLEAGVRTILMLPHQPMAHFDRYYPHFWWVLTEMTTLQNFGVPDPPKVGRTRYVSVKKHDLRPIFRTKSSIWPILNISTPPHDIHRWKAMDLSLDLAASYRDSKHPTRRQNFDDAVKWKWMVDLRPCHIVLPTSALLNMNDT